MMALWLAQELRALAGWLRFDCADDADDTDAKKPNPSGLWIRDCVYRACYCLPTSGDGVRNRPAVSQAGSALLPGCREITAQAKDKPMLRGDSLVWPTRFFGLAKEHANKPRVVAAVDAESDIDAESSVPVVKSRTVSESLRECGALHVSSSQKIPCRPHMGHFQRLPSYAADPTAFKELRQNRGAAERRVRPMGEYKPFTYSTTQWAAIRRELPSLPTLAS
jgi:hypothetical protein